MEDMRVLFDTIAKKYNFDPLIAENWYSIKYTDVRGEENVR
jgi:hypothetical protein